MSAEKAHETAWRELIAGALELAEPMADGIEPTDEDWSLLGRLGRQYLKAKAPGPTRLEHLAEIVAHRLDDPKLRHVLRKAFPEPEGEEESAEPLILTFDEYRAQAAEQLADDWVIPTLYRRGQSSLLVGEPKAGKSTLCRRIALAVARGDGILGQRVEPAIAVYMPLQEHPQLVVREIEELHSDPGVRLCLHNPQRAMAWEGLAQALTDMEAAIVMVDMLADFRAWEDGNDYAEMKRVVGEFTRLARETGAHVMCVHHGNKQPANSYPTARVLGSNAIAGEVDVVASVHRDPKKGRVYQAEGRGIGFTEHIL